jgi:LysM repeat protein
MTRISHHELTTDTMGVGFDPAPALRARIAGGIVITAFSLLLIIGMPFFLYHVVGSRWPDRGPVLHDFDALHLRSDTELLLGLLAVAGWTLWGVFVLLVLHAVVTSIIDTLRWGVAAETWRDAANPVRWIAGMLIGAVAALWPTAAHAAPSEPVDQTVAGHALTGDELAHLTAATAGDEVTPPTTATVGPGDSLYSLAREHYGDGNRWPQIWRANEGATMSNGQPFTDPDLVIDGTELTIPEPTTTAPSEDSNTATVNHTVRAGQTLYGLAEQYLGDGNRWPQIWEANQGTTFADGRTFTDPHTIHAGWELAMPIGHGPSGSDDAPVPDPEPEGDPEDTTELEGEGEVTTPSAEPPDPSPEDNASTPDHTGDTSPATSEPDSGEQEQHLPAGIWLTAGTFLSAITIIALAAKFRRRRRSTRPAHVPQRLTGRLTDLEVTLAEEDLHLPDAAREPLATHDESVPIGTDYTRTIQLADLANPALSLFGPGQGGAARGTIITALAADQPITVTAAALEYTQLEALAEPLTAAGAAIATDIESALATTSATPPLQWIICAEPDLDDITEIALTERLSHTGTRAIVLSGGLSTSLTLAADGTVQETAGMTGELGIKSCYIADVPTVEALLVGLAAPDMDRSDSGPEAIEDPPREAEGESGLLPADPEIHHPASTTPDDGQPTELAQVRLCLFGYPSLYRNDKPIALKQGRRALALLATLALTDNEHGCTRDDLLGAVLWDEQMGSAKKYLPVIVSDTRADLCRATEEPKTETKFIIYDRRTRRYRLEPGRFTIDRDEFDALEQDAALTEDAEQKAELLERAVSLYAGDLADLLEIDTLTELRNQYRNAVRRACRTLVEHYEAEGSTARADNFRRTSSGIAA